jgi:hypothetical protein
MIGAGGTTRRRSNNSDSTVAGLLGRNQEDYDSNDAAIRPRTVLPRHDPIYHYSSLMSDNSQLRQNGSGRL